MNFKNYLTDELPGFDPGRFTQDCLRDGCSGHLVIDHLTVTDGPVEDSKTTVIVTRCTAPFCGCKQSYQLTIDGKTEEHLCSLWASVTHQDNPTSLWPWSSEHTDDVETAMSAVYTDEEKNTIQTRLKDLGYW